MITDLIVALKKRLPVDFYIRFILTVIAILLAVIVYYLSFLPSIDSHLDSLDSDSFDNESEMTPGQSATKDDLFRDAAMNNYGKLSVQRNLENPSIRRQEGESM